MKAALNRASEFGDHLWTWPWQRFAASSEPSGVAGFLIWQLLTWAIQGRLFDPFERLELAHIAAVVDREQWFQP